MGEIINAETAKKNTQINIANGDIFKKAKEWCFTRINSEIQAGRFNASVTVNAYVIEFIIVELEKLGYKAHADNSLIDSKETRLLYISWE